MERTRILLVDDHAIVRTGVKMLLSQQQDMEVVGEAAEGNEALQKAAELNPHLVLMDLSMPNGKDGLSATSELKRLLPQVHVLILTMHDDEEYLFRVLQVGASGYVMKSALDTELTSAIREVRKGNAYLYPSAAKRLVEDFLQRVARGEEVQHYRLLSEREQEVMTLIAKGYTNREIAEKLFISVKTVETHKAKVMEKLGYKTRHELVTYAARKGWLDLERPFRAEMEG